MTLQHSSDKDYLPLKFVFILGCYFALHVALRVAVSDSLDYDEAEQALLGQWLLPGYTDQPPLYTWLQYFFFQFFGKNVFAVSLLKNGFLFFTYFFVFLGSREILNNTRAAILAAASLLLIPQIGWESQRDMTHTTLVVLAASITLWQTMRLIKKQNFMNYGLLGLFLGIGFLSKANFGVFLTVMFLALISLPEGRKAIFNPKIAITLLISAALAGDYVFWIIHNRDIFFSATHKFKQGIGNYYFHGILSLFTNSLLFLSPWWLFALFVFPAGFGPGQNPTRSFYRLFIKRYMLGLFLLLVFVVILFKVTYVKDRWLQPLLFAAPIFFFSRLDPGRIRPKRFKAFLIIVAVAGFAIYTAFIIRAIGGYYTRDFCRLNYPFDMIADDVRKSGASPELIISDNRFIAGNMHFQFPASTAIIPGYRFERLVGHSADLAAAVFWKADRSPDIPAGLAAFLKNTYAMDTSDFPIKYFERPYKFGRPTDTVKLAMIQFVVPAESIK